MKPMTLYRMQIHADSAYEPHIQYYEELLGIKNFDPRGVLCLGEISNMPNHYAIVGMNGKTVYGLHSDIFQEMIDD
jgi:hypothetical protein